MPQAEARGGREEKGCRCLENDDDQDDLGDCFNHDDGDDVEWRKDSVHWNRIFIFSPH